MLVCVPFRARAEANLAEGDVKAFPRWAFRILTWVTGRGPKGKATRQVLGDGDVVVTECRHRRLAWQRLQKKQTRLRLEVLLADELSNEGTFILGDARGCFAGEVQEDGAVNVFVFDGVRRCGDVFGAVCEGGFGEAFFCGGCCVPGAAVEAVSVSEWLSAKPCLVQARTCRDRGFRGLDRLTLRIFLTTTDALELTLAAADL